MDETRSDSTVRPVAPCLDPATLDQLLGLDDGGTGLVAELFDLFREDTPERMDALRRAVDGGEAGLVSDLAHALKGAAGTMGAFRMRTIAQEIELASKSGRLDPSLAGRVPHLEEAYAEACGALRAFLGQS